MKLSTRGRYGIQTMYDLALNADNGPQSIKAIAERGGMPEAYLEQLIAALKRSGLVTSTRGAQGGYMLARPADAISVGDVLRVLEGGLNLVNCLDGEDCCEKACACPSRTVWMKWWGRRTGITSTNPGTAPENGRPRSAASPSISRAAASSPNGTEPRTRILSRSRADSAIP